jgi:hypothetical protein
MQKRRIFYWMILAVAVFYATQGFASGSARSSTATHNSLHFVQDQISRKARLPVCGLEISGASSPDLHMLISATPSQVLGHDDGGDASKREATIFYVVAKHRVPNKPVPMAGVSIKFDGTKCDVRIWSTHGDI